MFKTKFEKGCMLIVGGAKSGKSRLALDVCNSLNRKRIFLATAQALDREMEERIKRHQEERSGEWHTVEEPLNLVSMIRTLDAEDTAILIECLTLWLSNLYMKFGEDREPISQAMEELVDRLSRIRGVVVVVSNEVGMGTIKVKSTWLQHPFGMGGDHASLSPFARPAFSYPQNPSGIWNRYPAPPGNFDGYLCGSSAVDRPRR